MTETGLNGAIGIPSGLNRIKIRRSVTDPLSSSSSSPRPPLVDHIMKDRDKRHPKIRGRKHGSSGLSKGKKIARWFTSYLAKDSHQMSNDNHPNTAANTLEIKMVDKKGVQGNMHSNGKESSEEIPDTRRPPPGFKSFSHELGPKGGIRPFSSRAHSYDDLKEMLGSLRSRFDAAKVVVNAELANFVQDVEEVFGEECSSPPKGLNEARDLLFLAQKCTKMASSELREECGGIVQDLADKRQQCQAGTIKQLYTRLLFILTRCTRLLQFEKDNEPIDENSLHKFKRCLESIPCVEMNWMGKPEQPPNSDLKDTLGKKGSSISPVHEFMVVRPQNRVATNLRKDSIALKQKSILRSSQINVESSETSITVHGPDDVEPLPGDKVFSEYQNAKGQVIPQVEDSSPGNSLPKQTCSLLHERDASFDGSDSVICRICEEVVPTSHLESHSYVCAYAEKCDLKCLDVDERLSKLADVLEQIVDSHSSSQHASCGSPDIARMQTANAAGSGGQSPKMIEWHSKGVEGMFEDLHEMDTAFIDEPHLGSSSNLKSYLGMKLGHQGGPSSTGSMTSMSSNNTPRASHFDLYWLEQNNAAELEEVHQMTELVDIARQVAITDVTKEGGSDYLLACMHDLQDILEHSRIKGLVVDTFGSRIENILREKYLLACESMDDKSPSTRRYKDGDGCLMDSPSQSSGVSTPLHPAHRDRISIDDFEILKPISRGAFGKVFLARKRTTGDLFAIKVLKKLDMIRKNDIERILAERNILITVRNPFVVRFFYSFTCRDNLYLVMEYLNGGDLYSLLKNVGSLEEDVARTYVAELVLALEYLHSLGIVHRDLKPDNILIAHDGHIKLTDFGLSKIGLINSTDNLSGSETNSSNLPEVDDLSSSFENTDQQTEERFQHSAVGTPDYLAPEILLGTEHGYAADWWSVGIILFELITGIPPFSAESPEMIFDNILNKKMPWPSVPDDMSYEAQDLINRFLNLDPSRRLGANGAPEVKTHPFFRGVNWNTLALQKAAFIPSPENPADTSYFMSRYPQASNRISEDESYGDSSSDTTNSCSKSGIEMDECGDLADFNSSSFDLSMINFSFKNLSQLAAINYDVLMQRDPSSCSSPSRGTDL